MGGSSKPADPKVTPYQEPAPPTNPIPNFFGGQAGGGYKPNTGASQQAFTMPAAQPQQAPAQPQQAAPDMEAPQTPWQAPQQPQSQPMQGMTGGMGQQGANMGGMANMGGTNRPMMPFGIPTRQNFGQGFGGGFDTNALMQRFQSNPNFLMDMFRGGDGNAPRYRNYTDTNAAQSTDAFGRPIEQPSTRMFSNIPGTDWRG